MNALLARLLPAAFWTMAVAAFALGCSQGSPEKPVSRDAAVPITTAQVELVPLDRTLTVVGTLFPMDEAMVAAQVEGMLDKTFVDFGDCVGAGQELALIDTASYEALAQQAAANVARAKANALNAEQNLKRVRDLQASRISSASELDTATAQSEQARAEVQAAEATESIARLNLSRSRVKAPFEGSVAERSSNAGDYVKAGTLIFRLVNDGELRLIVQAPERYSGEIKLGQKVRFTVDAYPGRAFEGEVFLVNPAVNMASRSFSLAARVSNPERTLKANTFARGTILLEQAMPTPMVPLDAVLNFAGVNKVFVINGTSAKAREVRTGRIQDSRQEILEGLEPGDTVAVTGVSKLYDDAPVRRVDVGS